MNNQLSPSKIRPVVFAIMGVLPVLASASTVSATIKAGGEWYDPANVAIEGDSSASFHRSQFFGLDTGEFYHHYASVQADSDGAGHFGTSLFADNDSPYHAWSSSNVTFKETIRNGSATSQAANFNLNINSFSMSVQTGHMNDNQAMYSLSVYRNDEITPIWSSTGEVRTAVGYNNGVIHGLGASEAPITSFSGASLGLAASSAYINDNLGFTHSYSLVSPFSTLISLGDVNAGEDVSVRYEVNLYAMTNAYGGKITIDFQDPSGIAMGSASAQPTSMLAFSQPVPEPETYAMMAAGLALLAGVRRRQKRG